jgi:hypothetical protein
MDIWETGEWIFPFVGKLEDGGQRLFPDYAAGWAFRFLMVFPFLSERKGKGRRTDEAGTA